METEIEPNVYVESLDEFEEWNHDVLRDIYNEIRGFFGGIRTYTYFVREVYVDTHALKLLFNGSDLIPRYKYFVLEPYDENCDSTAYNENLLRKYNQIADFRERILHEIIGGRNIFITNETIWNMAYIFHPKNKKNGNNNNNVVQHETVWNSKSEKNANKTNLYSVV